MRLENEQALATPDHSFPKVAVDCSQHKKGGRMTVLLSDLSRRLNSGVASLQHEINHVTDLCAQQMQQLRISSPQITDQEIFPWKSRFHHIHWAEV